MAVAPSNDLIDTGPASNNYTYTGVKLTGYSAACRYDRQGGRNESSSDQRLKPRSHTLDGDAASDKVVVAAVPQFGGTASLYRCFFKLVPPANAPQDIKTKMSQKIFFGGDHYGAGSNRKMKIDVSYGCSRDIQKRTYNNAKIQRLNCLPRKANVMTAINDLVSSANRIAEAGTTASATASSSEAQR
ncbi:MAG: hypothetical protein ACXWQE_06800 [Bdellovibrionales bacterium]